MTSAGSAAGSSPTPKGYAIAGGMDALRIVADQTNWRARSFYRRSGFAPVEPELFELVLPRGR